VLEPLRGYLTLAERLYSEGNAFAEAFNFGPHSDDAQPVEWIVRRMADTWGEGASWEVDVGQHPHEAHFLKLDISKAAQRLQWHPAMRLDEALRLTVDWACGRLAGANLRELTCAQIQTYQAKACGHAPT
jgi:CDP-glucose 4,6-dehydratase